MHTSLPRLPRAIGIARYAWATSRRLKAIRRGHDVARHARELVDDTSRAGVLFVKMAQFVSARDDIVDNEDVRAALAKLQDSVTDVDVEPPAVEGYVVDGTPMAVASVAAVYRARRVEDGAAVVVKRVRPGVRQRIEEDIPLLVGVLRVAQTLGVSGAAGMVELVFECVPMLHAELDLRVEAESQRALAAALVLRRVRVPRVLAASADTMVSEFVASRKITDAVPTPALAKRLFAAYVHMALDAGLVHADPHPGNIGVRRDGSLVLYDFGAVVDVRDARAHVAQLAKAALVRDVDEGVRALAAMGVIRDVPDSTLRRLLPKLRRVLASRDVNEELARLPEFSDNQRRILQLSTRWVYLIRSAVIVQGILRYHDSAYDFQEYAKAHESDIRAATGGPWQLATETLAEGARDVMGVPRSLRAMEDAVADMRDAMADAGGTAQLAAALALSVLANVLLLARL